MHQSVIKVTRWNLKVISLRIPLHKDNFRESLQREKD